MFDSEKHIVQRLKAKDQRAFEKLYDKYSRPLFGLILRMTKNEQLSEEILQEVFLKLWNNAEKFDPAKSKLFTWLYQIARNTTLNTLNLKGERTNRLMDYKDQFKIDPSIQSNYETLDIKGVLKNLDKKYIDVIELIYFKAFTFKEASEALNLPLGTVKTRVRYALKEMKKYYDYKGQKDLKSIAILIIMVSIWIG